METKTIEERAKAYAKTVSVESGAVVYDAYIAGAKEQREIDIQRTVDILRATGYFDNDEGFSEEVMIDQFKQAMKGE